MAQTIARAMKDSGYRSLGTRLQALDRVSAAAVRDAARRFLNPQVLTLYHYAPAGAPEVTAEAALATVRSATARP